MVKSFTKYPITHLIASFLSIVKHLCVFYYFPIKSGLFAFISIHCPFKSIQYKEAQYSASGKFFGKHI